MLQRNHKASLPRWLLIGLAVLASAAAVALPKAEVHAQSRQLSVSIDGFSSQNWPQAQAILTVLDANGKPVEGLSDQSIQAQIDGTEVATTAVSRGVDSNLPSFVVLAIDASGGMAGAPLDQAKAAAHEFVNALGPQDSVAILAYSDAPSLVQTFTQDRGAAHLSIDSLIAGGGNGLYKAATQGVLLGAASAQSGRRALVLLSSGPDSTQADPRQSLVAAQGLGVPVFIIGLGDTIDRSYLEQLTVAGGGRFTETPAPDGLSGLYHDVSELLRNQYVVGLDASALEVERSRPVTLHIDVAAGESAGAADRVVCPALVCADFRDLQSGARLAESQTITADVLSSENVQSVSLLVDGTSVQTLQNAPYEFTFEAEKYGGGTHTFALMVTTSSGTATFAELSVEVGAQSGSSSTDLLVVALVVVLVLVVVVALFFVLRRRKPSADIAQPLPPNPEPSEPVSIMIAKNRGRQLTQRDDPPTPLPRDPETVLGYLKMTAGPLAGQTFAVGPKPVSIGSGHRCPIKLPEELEGYEVPSEYARVWIRAGQLMVHEIRRLTAMGAVGGQWQILANRDTFAIGPCVFSFELAGSLPVQPASKPEPVVNVLRDRPQEAKSLSAHVAEAASSVGEPVSFTPPADVPDVFRDRGERSDDDDGPPAEQAAGG